MTDIVGRAPASSKGWVGLQTTSRGIDLVERRQVRRWWFWKRWAVYVLASVRCEIQPEDTITLRQYGLREYVAYVNLDPVLEWRRSS